MTSKEIVAGFQRLVDAILEGVWSAHKVTSVSRGLHRLEGKDLLVDFFFFFQNVTCWLVGSVDDSIKGRKTHAQNLLYFLCRLYFSFRFHLYLLLYRDYMDTCQ